MPLLDAMFDNAVWLMLQYYYLPYKIMGSGDLEQFVKQFTLNGIKGTSTWNLTNTLFGKTPQTS